MNEHTRLAREWLDRRYSRDAEGGYLAHQPIEGLRTTCSEPNALLRLARTFRLLEVLQALEFDSFIDVGGGEGYVAAMVRDLCGTGVVHSSDLSVQACQRAGELFAVQGVASDITTLPLADNSYDVVLCSEVIEHLSSPVLAIGELARIARKYVIISTAEFCPLGEVERLLRSRTLDADYPHAEVNWFTARDFRVLMGNAVSLGSQFHGAAQLLADREQWTREDLERVLTGVTASYVTDVDHVGVIAICPRAGALPATVWERRPAEVRQRTLDRLLNPPPRVPRPPVPDAPMEDTLASRLRCVLCRGGIDAGSGAGPLTCVVCAQTYEVSGGVPRMFAEGGDVSAPATVEACVAGLAAGDPARDLAIRRLVSRLHKAQPEHHSPLMRWSASQLLRLLWLICRDEPVQAKTGRFLRRLGIGAAAPESEAVLQSLRRPAPGGLP